MEETNRNQSDSAKARAVNSSIYKKMNPSRQYLVGKLRDYQKRLDVYQNRWENCAKDNENIADKTNDKAEKHAVIAACRAHLNDIECMINDDCAKRFKKTFTIWHLFHRVDEYFYLLMDEPELKAQGWELFQGLKISPVSQQTKTEWIVKIQESLKKLDGPNPPTDRDLKDAARVLNAASYIHNDCVDNLFWDYWCRKYFALIYTVGLFFHLALFIVLYSCFKFTLCAWSALLIGAIGGLISGIMTTQIETIPYGQFWVSTLYHALVRPLQGSIAALMVFWMLQSQYLLKIDPPLVPGRIVFTCTSSNRIELPVTCTPPSVAVAFSNRSGAGYAAKPENKSDPLLVLKSAPGMQVYLYMLVLLIAGFSGDKALRYVSDKVSGRLFAEAEKTKEVK